MHNFSFHNLSQIPDFLSEDLINSDFWKAMVEDIDATQNEE